VEYRKLNKALNLGNVWVEARRKPIQCFQYGILVVTLGLIFKRLDVIYVDYKNYTVKKHIITTSSNILAPWFPHDTSLGIMLQVFCCSSLVVQVVGPGDRILGAHLGRNHNAQSIR
jgi:hypothetical protein